MMASRRQYRYRSTTLRRSPDSSSSASSFESSGHGFGCGPTPTTSIHRSLSWPLLLRLVPLPFELLTTRALGPRTLGPDWLDPKQIIESLGPWAMVGITAIIF